MMCYPVQPRDKIFVKSYGFLPSAKIMSKYICKNISKCLSGKYSQKLLDHTKESATDALETPFIKAIQETVKANGDLISNKIAYKQLQKSRELQ